MGAGHIEGGTPEQLWSLKTPSRAVGVPGRFVTRPRIRPPSSVAGRRQTRLGYQLRCLTDLHEMLRA